MGVFHSTAATSPIPDLLPVQPAFSLRTFGGYPSKLPKTILVQFPRIPPQCKLTHTDQHCFYMHKFVFLFQRCAQSPPIQTLLSQSALELDKQTGFLSDLKEAGHSNHL